MSEILYKSTGKLHYSITDVGYKLVVAVDPGIAMYYRSMIPKYIAIPRPQKYPTHISVVRKETPPNLQFWEKYKEEPVEFFYSPVIHNDDRYFWLNAFCTRLEDIRVELGLPISSKYTRPPTGYTRSFHIIIGNVK